MSIGAATVEPGGHYSHEHAVRRADIALYLSKERGRDGWSCHEAADELPEMAEFRKTAS